MSLQPGDKLGPYEILAPIGAGGMGEVYKARDPRLNRIVAIKRLKASTRRVSSKKLTPSLRSIIPTSARSTISVRITWSWSTLRGSLYPALSVWKKL